MQKFLKLLTIITLSALVLFGAVVYAQQEGAEDKTLAPYFFVKSDNPDIDQLPLKSTSVIVNISGVIADIKVTQVYKNNGKTPLEAIYVFPASTKVAVYGMKMTIGERIINAEIKTRDEARQDYEDAKQQGKRASLLEQQRPNVFQMSVANIMPGDVIKVELSYTELLVPTDKTYEFVYPTVVGPRYSNQPADTAPASERWIQNPYLHQGELPTYTFDITVNLATGLPIHKVYCTSHKVNVDFDGQEIAAVKLDESERYGGNRDYVLKYRLNGEQIESGLLLYKGEHENFFLLMMQPPKRVEISQILPREYIFIVDVSGSMHGFPLDISKELLKDLIGKLRPTDKFNVLLFAGGSSVMSGHSLPATAENIRKAINLIERQRGGGGTELLPALKRALALPKADGYSRTIVIATDGYVSVEEQAFDLIRNNLGNANMFTFGIGSSVNRHLIEGMATVGMGEPFIITNPKEAKTKANDFRKLIQSPVLTQINVDYGKFRTYDVEPLSIPDVLAERPVIVFGKWKGKPEGKIILSGIAGDKPYADVIDVSKVKPLDNNTALRYLWARYRIKLLSDYNRLRPDDERIKEITNLGLTYNLLTAYTSFVAIDTEVRNDDGKQTTVNQPLPLPQGVSDYAIGNSYKRVSSAPYLSQQFSSTGGMGFVHEEVAQTEKDKRHVKAGKITISGSLSKNAVQKVLQQHINNIQSCYAKSGLKGKFTVKLVIGSNGNVKSVSIFLSELKNKNAEKCIVRQIKKWQFPAAQKGKETKAIITLVFTL